MSVFIEEQINSLRLAVCSDMSECRFAHTAEVENMAVRLGELYAPKYIDVLRVAALLHDITKEKNSAEQVQILEAYGASVTQFDLMSPAVLHSRTAALLIGDRENKYHDFAHPVVLSAVKNHTVGAPDMVLTDMLIYLADYIDMSRSFEDCVKLREYFWNNHPENMDKEERLLHLFYTLVMSFDLTIGSLVDSGKTISPRSIATRNELLLRIKNRDFSRL